MSTLYSNANANANANANDGGGYVYAETHHNAPEVMVPDHSASAPEVVPDAAPQHFAEKKPAWADHSGDTLPPTPPAKRPWHKRRRVWLAVLVLICVVIAAVVGGVVGSRSGGDDDDSAPAESDAGSDTTSSSAASSTPDPKSTATEATASTLSAAEPSATSESDIRAVIVPWTSDGCGGAHPDDQESITIEDGDCRHIDQLGKSFSIDQFTDGCKMYKFKEMECKGSWRSHVTEKACFKVEDYVTFALVC